MMYKGSYSQMKLETSRSAYREQDDFHNLNHLHERVFNR